MKKIKLSLFYWFFVLLFFVSCRNERQNTPTDGTTFIAVDETFSPIIRNEIDVFESIYKTAGILEIECPEVEAFNLLMKDSVRMIVATRQLSKEETEFLNSKNFFPKELKIAIDGIAFIVNPVNRDTLLTTTTIRKIMLGEIKSWEQVNAESKLGPIKMIFDNPKSSTAEFAVKTICGNHQLSLDLSALNSNLEVIDYVSKTANAIGIIGLSWIGNHKDSSCMSFLEKVKVIAVSSEEKATKKNSYQPYQACLATGQYPYSRNIYVIMSDPRIGLNTGFLSFIASDRGQRIILKSGILPATKPTREVKIKEDF
jgi:phosphate transport system substrate-binding protein